LLLLKHAELSLQSVHVIARTRRVWKISVQHAHAGVPEFHFAYTPLANGRITGYRRVDRLL
jgi:hypothetical protein